MSFAIIRWRAVILCGAAIAGAFASSNTLRASPIVYELVPEVVTGSGGEYDLTGTITTDGTFGQLSTSNLQSFSWTATQVGGVNVYSAGGTVVPNGGAFTATATDLSLAYPAAGSGSNLTINDAGYQVGPIPGNIQFQADHPGDYYTAVGVENDPGSFRAAETSPTSPVVLSPYIFATAVPEPSILSAFCMAGLYLTRRRREAV